MNKNVSHSSELKLFLKAMTKYGAELSFNMSVPGIKMPMDFG
jgi:hypothetical protein